MGFSYGRLMISNEIGGTNSCSRFCNFCSEHGGGYCDVAAEDPFEESKRLVAIRNSLKEVENMVLFLERLDSRKMMEMNEVFNSLEESRLNLLANVTEYSRKALKVLTELNACFGHENGGPFDCDSRERSMKHAEPADAHRSRRFYLITNCMRKLVLIPWKWQQKVGIAMKLAMCAIAAYYIRKMIHPSSRNMIPIVVSRGKSINSVLTISKNPFDVFYARG